MPADVTYPLNADLTVFPDHLVLGPGHLFAGTTPPDSGTPVIPLDLDASGIPIDGFFLGMTEGPSVVRWDQSFTESKADVASGPSHVAAMQAGLEVQVTLKEIQYAALLAVMPTTSITTAPTVVTFGGSSADVPTSTLFLVVPKIGTDPQEYVHFMLYKGYSAKSVELPFSKRRAATVAVTFRGLADLTRVDGDLMGYLYVPDDGGDGS